VIIDPSVTDTANAFVVKQIPLRKNSLNETNMIRAGESIDIWLSNSRPEKDSGVAPPAPVDEQDK
jgi:hypothetical protein